MPRPRQFDETQVVERAMDLFWRQGYEATSVADLCAHLGLGLGSLYNSFGSKHALFLAALDHYRARGAARREAALGEDGEVVAVIRSFFAAVVEESVADPDRRGCLVANSALELAARDPATAKRVRAEAAAVEDAFHFALVRARATGELSLDVDARRVARFLCGVLHGLRVQAKVDPDRRILEDIVSTALACLQPA